MWDTRSCWQLRGDSVDLTVFTGRQGWTVRLAAREPLSAMKGYATHHTDAIVAGESPSRCTANIRLSGPLS